MGVKPAFPPSLVVQVKALACELPHTLGLPLSRFSVEEIRQHVISQGLVAEISGATLWRWLSSDAIRPWKHRSWIFHRDPDFAAKAGPILDLYQRVWKGAPLGTDDYVLCADEKTSIQARRRKQPTLSPGKKESIWTVVVTDEQSAKVFAAAFGWGVTADDELAALVSLTLTQDPERRLGSYTESGLFAIRPSS